MLTSPGFILLFLIGAVTWYVARPLTQAVESAKRELSADDLKEYGELRRKKTPSTQMPSKFKNLVQSQASASKVWMLSVVAIVVTLFSIIFLGPGLGLFPYP